MANELALIAGIGGLVFYLYILAADFNSKPAVKQEKTIGQWLRPQHWAVFIKLVASWVVVGGLGFLVHLTNAETYATFFENLFVIGIYVNVGFNILYLTLYVMFTTTQSVESAGDWRYWNK